MRIIRAQKPGVNVLLEMKSGKGIVLPAIPDFIATLRVESDEVVDVTYEPSDNTSRWQSYKDVARGLTALRRAVAAASQAGVFRLEEESALELARLLENMKQVDPSLFIYAAYAYNKLDRKKLMGENE